MSSPNLPPQAQQLLAQMHDINASEAVSWWPLAPGWWALICLTVALLGGGAFWLKRRAQNNRYRREALALLANIASQPETHSLSDINDLIKRAALYAYPNERADIARAHGERWVAWLNSKSKAPVFTGQAAKALSQGPYSGKEIAIDPLIAPTDQWLRVHGKGAG